MENNPLQVGSSSSNTIFCQSFAFALQWTSPQISFQTLSSVAKNYLKKNHMQKNAKGPWSSETPWFHEFQVIVLRCILMSGQVICPLSLSFMPPFCILFSIPDTRTLKTTFPGFSSWLLVRSAHRRDWWETGGEEKGKVHFLLALGGVTSVGRQLHIPATFRSSGSAAGSSTIAGNGMAGQASSSVWQLSQWDWWPFQQK